MRAGRKAAKRDAADVAEELLNLAVRRSKIDLNLAKEQTELARRVMLKFNVRLDYSLKRFICHGCKKLLVPGANARVRLGRGTKKTKMLRVTCLECGHVNRKLLAVATNPTSSAG